MRMLVLGGSKFIGRTAVERLAADHEVTVLVRGKSEPPPGVRVIRGDRTDPGVAVALSEPFDAIVDISGTTADMITNLVPAFSAWDFARYVYIGSGSVYDRQQSPLPFTEAEPATGDAIWGDYGAAKALCEDALRTSVDPQRLVILRPPYVYGPRNYEDRERWIWARVLGGHPVFIPRESEKRIQFCHVDVLAAVIDAAATGNLAPGTYNVADDLIVGLRDWVELCCSVAGRAGDLRPAVDPTTRPRDYFPFRAADFYLDVTRVTATGVVRPIALEDGLRGTLDWFQANGGLEYEPTATESAWIR